MPFRAISDGPHHAPGGVIARLRLEGVQELEALRSTLGRDTVTLSVHIESSGADGSWVIVRLAPPDFEMPHAPAAADDRPTRRFSPLASVDAGRQAIAAHAAERWANAVVPLIDSPTDPRTIEDWSRWIAASPGAVRNWCHTASVGPRRSLVFGRLLRAVILSENGRHKPENVLDVVDRRTLSAMLKLAGFGSGQAFPPSIERFLDEQALIRDVDMLRQLERVFEQRYRARTRPSHAEHCTALHAV